MRAILIAFAYSLLAATGPVTPLSMAAEKVAALTPAQLQTVVKQSLAQNPDYHTGNLLRRTEVEAALVALSKEGVVLTKEQQTAVLNLTLPDSSPLIRELETPQGKAFVRKSQNNTLLYDQLDRILQHQGGERLIHDLIRLPDGYRYARQKQPQGSVNMREFLPKTSRGNSIPTQVYNQPTGRIYDEQQLLKKLELVLEVGEK